jgi:hypothetical protein
MNEIEYILSDVIIGRPHGFTVGRKHFYLYPVTLAKMYLLKRQIDNLDINNTILKANPYLEAIRVAKEHRDVCCNILAYHTAPNTYKDLFDNRAISIRKNFFAKELTDEELATQIIMVLTADKTEELLQYLGLDKEREKLRKVMAVKEKHEKNMLSFNGKSLFGTFICQLKELGYTDNEILYEKGYTYLRLILADKVATVHLSDEERQDIPTTLGGTMLDGNDPKSREALKARLMQRGVKV